MNGDSLKTILQDYSNVVMALDNAINVIGEASSLYHGRNSFSKKHEQAMREQLLTNQRALIEMRDQYENDLRDLDQPFINN